MQIIEFIKKEINEKGMAYEKLAEEMGTTRQSVWIKINRSKNPSFEAVRKMLDILGYTIIICKKGEEPEEKDGCILNASR